MHDGFIDAGTAIKGAIIEPRYAGPDNFMGRPVEAYLARKVIVSKAVATALVAVQAELEPHGMALKLYDGYRPQQAVDHFVRWAKDEADTVNKASYYPKVKKGDLFALGYIAERSGHSRGGSVDLTVVQKMPDGTLCEMDMGSPWDLFDQQSHSDSDAVSNQAQKNRRFLRELMERHGFEPYAEEWWHFTLVPEPYPDTYFDFPIE